MARHSGALIELIEKEKIEIFAEIGIQFGDNLRKILYSPNMIKEYWAIDSWGIDSSNNRIPYMSKHGWIKTPEDWQSVYRSVCQQMIHFKQLHVIKSSSVEAADLFPDGYFDMVYIDADHSYLGVFEDIKAWIPKVKINGILGGHDYNKRSVRKAVRKQLTEVWEPPPSSRGSTKIWLKRRVGTDEVEKRAVLGYVNKKSLWLKNGEKT